MKNKILIVGKTGQVARALAELLGESALGAGRPEVDLLDKDFISQLERVVGAESISAVINASAYTHVDKAEGEGRTEAMRINATALGELAAWCKHKNLPLVHYSTDYVFDGRGEKPWSETDIPHPINAYGASKLAGEQAIVAHGGIYTILRTSWVYDATGKNFFTTIGRLLKEKESLSIVADQIGAPTYAPHLAHASLSFLPSTDHQSPTGIYHLCNAGETSWYGFAQAIFAHEKKYGAALKCKEIHPIATSQYPLPAPRPRNSRLDCGKARALGIMLPHWEEGLMECFLTSAQTLA